MNHQLNCFPDGAGAGVPQPQSPEPRGERQRSTWSTVQIPLDLVAVKYHYALQMFQKVYQDKHFLHLKCVYGGSYVIVDLDSCTNNGCIILRNY